MNHFLQKINLLRKTLLGKIIISLLFIILISPLGYHLYNITHGRECPDEKPEINMTDTFGQKMIAGRDYPIRKRSGYVIINSEERNIEDYDIVWIIKNCKNPNYIPGN